MVVARLEAPPIVVAGPGLITLPEGAVVLPQPVAARTEPMRQEAVFVSTAVVERETEPAAQPVPAFEDRTETLLASIGAGTEAEQELPDEAPALAPPQPSPQPQPSAQPEPVLAIAEFAQAPEVEAPVAETAVVPEFQAPAPEPVTITQAGLGGVPFIAVAQQESVAPSIEAAEEGSGGAGCYRLRESALSWLRVGFLSPRGVTQGVAQIVEVPLGGWRRGEFSEDGEKVGEGSDGLELW